MSKLHLIYFICFVFATISCIYYPSTNDEVRLELPAYSESDCIIEYTGFTVSFHEMSRIPLWVAYELTANEVNGPIGRSGKYFRPDEKVAVVQADNDDYRGSGWSRGHMAPAGDFKWDERAMWDTFYFTNCCPQDEKLNNGSWNVLENKIRSWARYYGKVYVVTGPIIGHNHLGTIGAHDVIIPDAFYKVLLVFSNNTYHGIAFVMENNSIPQRLRIAILV